MSLMRINHANIEIKRLESVISNLISNYSSNFKEYDSKYKEVEDNLRKREQIANESENWDEFDKIIDEKIAYTKPLEILSSLGRLQNELILVKHVALIENMIVNIFRCLVYLLRNDEYKEKYFIEVRDFSDSYEAANKINELTSKEINLKKSKFWYLYETMKTIRNTVAHGDPLFVISYKRAKKFNMKIDMIQLYSEKNDCELTKKMYPIRLHPTCANKSNWFCHLSDDLGALAELNNRSLGFIEETKVLFLDFGKKRGFSDHELYGCQSYNKANPADAPKTRAAD